MNLPLWNKFNNILGIYWWSTASMYVRTHQAAGSYSAHILTYSSRWWGPRMDESLVRYSKLSMMTATNRFSICTSKNLLDVSAEMLFVANYLLIPIRYRRAFRFFTAYRWVSAQSSYQEWTEENKGDEVEVGKLAATLRVCVPWQGVAFFIPQTRQHDFMPRLSRCAPKKNTHRPPILEASGWQILQLNWRTHLKSSIRAWMNVLKLLCSLMALSPSSSIAMFPNSW